MKQQPRVETDLDLVAEAGHLHHGREKLLRGGEFGWGALVARQQGRLVLGRDDLHPTQQKEGTSFFGCSKPTEHGI